MVSNHENHKRLNAFPVEEWHGGKVHKIRPSVIHLMRGEIFDIAGYTFFAFGGAKSLDKMYRIKDKSWWAEEFPTQEEMDYGIDNLKKHNNKVDYIISHAPSILAIRYRNYFNTLFDDLNLYFQQVHYIIEYKHHYCGHLHDEFTCEWEKLTCLYDTIERIC